MSKARLRNRRILYLFMILICGLVSVYDNVLNHVTMDTLKEQEQNPVALFIITHWGFFGLIYIKSLGTIASVLIMISLVYSKWRVAIIPVFIFQLVLFCYLTFYTSHHPFGPDVFTVPKLVLDFYA
jgi:hypothetical protein